MNERKILLFIFFAIIYCCYSVQMWFMTRNVETTVVPNEKIKPDILPEAIAKYRVAKSIRKVKKVIPLSLETCSVLDTFTEKLPIEKDKPERMSADNNTITVIGITVFLIILVMNAVLDVLKVKEEERARLRLNPDGERRQSLAEFANKKMLRRESSKFGLQLFQIAESFVGGGEDKSKKQTRPYTRGDSTNSYLSERKSQLESAPASLMGEASGEQKLVKRQSLAKLVGARPVPMVRRSSFPVLPLNPEVQALMLGHKQASFDSDDEDGKGRRVRIIRRY
ncbi:Outer membrane efflux protein [Operophtera brumata]|uniref:Outer membrane efflux protein n=1 Tax=Operophtera brumata TaxID=104452 RepID=A0A0L7LE64_OPEBR|nr:Outer membrane efflux protein [Operophtera brumata]